MTSKISTVRRITLRGAFYLAVLAIANACGALDLWQSSNCCTQTVTVYPGQNLQTLVNQNPQGTTFSLTPGIYRLQSVQPQSYDSFVGQPGAILSGTTQLTSFTQQDSYWVSWTQVTWTGNYPGQCNNSSSTACIYPEDLFFNGSPKTRVLSLSSVAPGTWYLDYTTGNVYMGDNPSGYTVEISLAPYAFAGPATSVTISNLTVEEYACVAQAAAIDGSWGSNYWQVINNQVHDNHGRGISTGNGMNVNGNSVYMNGQLGIGGEGNGVLIASNQIYYNNYAGYSYYWEAGGTKLASAQNFTFEYNSTYDNYGPGVWVDINSQNVTITGNQFTGNIEAGVLSEISNNVTISSNYIWDDATNPSGTGIWWGAGILIVDSTNVSVYYNSVSNCMDGIGGILVNRGDGPMASPIRCKM